MNELNANLVILAAQQALEARLRNDSFPFICFRIYENHPFGVAKRIVNQIPVKFSYTVDNTIQSRFFTLNQEGGAIILPIREGESIPPKPDKYPFITAITKSMIGTSANNE